MRTTGLLQAAIVATATFVGVTERLEAQDCRQDPTAAQYHIHYVRRFIARNPSSAAVHGMSVADTNQIQLVSDSTTCAQALSAYNASVQLESGTPASDGVFVLAVNSGTWVVFDPCATPGEYMEYIVFNADFTERLRISP
jgi:hypothetical protein